MKIKFNILYRIIVFIIVLYLIDLIIGNILSTYYFKQKSGQQKSLTYVLENVKSDILVMGNSRAQHHYISKILTDSLKYSCYNAGLDGGHSILLPYGQLKIILTRYTPKILLIEIDPFSFFYDAGDYLRLSVFLPYVKKYSELESFVCLKSPYERFKLISNIYPYNSEVLSIFRFNFINESNDSSKGYIPLNKVMSKNDYDNLLTKLKKIPKRINKIDPIKVNALKEIFRICNEKGIKLFLICSPYFFNDDEHYDFYNVSFDQILTNLFDEDLVLFDFSKDKYFNNRFELFYDYSHLNDHGARVFSAQLAHVLKEYIANQKNELKSPNN